MSEREAGSTSSTPSGEGDPWGERLPRRLGLFSAVAVLVGSTIGSGIFRTPAVIAGHVDVGWQFALVWIVGGAVALAGALTLAELAAAFPRSGGTYVYIREAFGRLPAFLFGWAQLLILRPSSYGAISITSSEYLWRLLGRDGGAALALFWPWFPFDITIAQGTAGLMILAVGLINIRGVHLGAWVQNLTTVLKVFALLALVVLGLVLTASHPVDIPAPPVDPEAPPAGSLAAFGVATIAVLWAYDGWSDAGFVSGEVKNPQRVLPRAFILGTAGVVALYLAANYVYIKVVGLQSMPGSELVAADVASALLGPIGVTLIAGAVMISTFGTLNGTMMTGPRVFFAMAEDKLFFERIGKVHPKFGTPAAAIMLSVCLGIVFVSIRDFAELADGFVIGIWPFYILAVAAVLTLRRHRPSLPRPYKTWGYPVVPLLFLLASVGLLTNYAVTQPGTFFANIGVILVGVPVYFLWTRRATERA